MKSELAVSRELCAIVIEKHSDQFLEDVAWFCPYAFYLGFVPKSAVSQSTVVPQSMAMCVRPSCVRLSLKLWIRRQPHRQMLLPLVAPPLPLNQSKSPYCSTQFSAVLILSSQVHKVHKDDVHACKVPDLLLDQAFAGSVTAGRFTPAGKALFWQTSASLRKECWSSESPSKLTVFFKLKLKGSRHPSYLKGIQTALLPSKGMTFWRSKCTMSPLAGYLSARTKMLRKDAGEGLGRPVAAGVLTDMAMALQTIGFVVSSSKRTNLSWKNCTLSPLAGYLSAKPKLSRKDAGLAGVGRPVSGVLTDMAVVLHTVTCVASAVPSLTTCRMVLPAMHKFSRKVSFSFSMPNHIH